jgi:hypothetical protein
MDETEREETKGKDTEAKGIAERRDRGGRRVEGRDRGKLTEGN